MADGWLRRDLAAARSRWDLAWLRRQHDARQSPRGADGGVFPVLDGPCFGRLAADAAHFSEFARAIKGGPAATSNFPDYAGPLTETVLLGNLAVWAGKEIEWDAKNLKASNAPEVAPLIRPPYRKGYTL